ncbi:MAG: hypothetical protein CG440_1005 [Methanosaeta sp. NSM2]|nr:MAG: hypothetical protein CG440_1005 [Methanosaeta sp. NSM2]
MSFRAEKWEHKKNSDPCSGWQAACRELCSLHGFISLFSYGFKWPRDGIHFTVLDIICAYQLVLIHNAAICKGYYHLWVNIT